MSGCMYRCIQVYKLDLYSFNSQSWETALHILNGVLLASVTLTILEITWLRVMILRYPHERHLMMLHRASFMVSMLILYEWRFHFHFQFLTGSDSSSQNKFQIFLLSLGPMRVLIMLKKTQALEGAHPWQDRVKVDQQRRSAALQVTKPRGSMLQKSQLEKGNCAIETKP